MGYYSDFKGTITTKFDADRNEFELRKLSRKFGCPFTAEEFEDAFKFVGHEIRIAAWGWRWYDFEKDMRLVATELTKKRAQPRGEVFVAGEDKGDFWKLEFQPRGKVVKKVGRIVYE